MTEPNSTTKPASQDRAPEAGADQGDAARTPEVRDLPTSSEGELTELARTRDDAARRARQLVAGEVATRVPDGEEADQRAHRLLAAVRADLLAELRQQEQEQARRQLAEATRSSEDAVAGIVQGVATIVRSIVPAVLVRPEDVVEATYALADQGLRVGRRLALTATHSVRSLSLAG
ncbi:hypothetical protein [Geodermatophilus sp. DSM 45219]|uniref:hypothetical protein n=1 Tax=Geodermatophilus sp. DSM 45219 TaxID=1881103 RepID=UPI00088D79AD|nr:hypothetical protein [Geodermatophilus sp. DSM 45219]SDO45856.1 hypothetical protein SAMN05428965_4022 [Geodermatophilus sp. DSM 45219]